MLKFFKIILFQRGITALDGRSMCGGDAAFCQITLTTCLRYALGQTNRDRDTLIATLCSPPGDDVIQGSAVTDKPARRAASRRTYCKQIRRTLSMINLRPN